jgi:hypothetical protein
MPSSPDFPETETLAQGLASIAKARSGLFAKSLAIQMQDTLASLAQKDKEAFSALRNEKIESDKLFDMSNEENKDLKAQNEHLKEENDILKGKCESYEAHFDKSQKESSGDITLRIKCAVDQKFPAEIEEYFKALLWEAAREAKNKLDKDSHLRKFQVLDDFIQENEQFSPLHSKAEKLADDIKTALKQDNTDKRLKALSKCGFELVPEQHGHPKIRFHGDHALQFSSAATPSDKRAGRNMEREIINKCLLLVD